MVHGGGSGKLPDSDGSLLPVSEATLQVAYYLRAKRVHKLHWSILQSQHCGKTILPDLVATVPGSLLPLPHVPYPR